jgi:hypothetical protein
MSPRDCQSSTSRLAAALALVLAAGSVPAQEAATLSFSAGAPATFPRTITGDKKVVIDLSALPRGAAIHRAVFRPGRDDREAWGARDAAVKVTSADGRPLELLPPRFLAFDATAAVRAAVTARGAKLTLEVASFPGHRPEAARVEVTCAARARNEVPAVTGLAARHRAGQTFLTWKEVEPPIADAGITFAEWKARTASLAGAEREVRYRIYRSAGPITAATIGSAELVDEVGPLTGWNPDRHGIAPPEKLPVPRYVVEDGKDPVPPGTGVYAHNPAAAGQAFYAVSSLVNGEEDFARLDAGGATRAPVEESVGPGEPVLQRVERPDSFNYIEKPVLHYFVRWEAPPRSHWPSRPIDYLVAVPPKSVAPAPAGLHLHCWGGSLDAGYGWWYNAVQGAVLIAANQTPYDWWTGYHEHLGTWKSWREGAVRDFTQERVLSFLDWAAGRWQLDRSRVFTAGSSMGGSGAISLALRRPEGIAWVVSWVGIHTPARSPGFRSSYEDVYGLAGWRLPYQDGKTPAFEWFDDTAFLRRDPGRETPLICFANGKNDGGIGWPQARDFWQALQETRRPHVFVWGQEGHGQRASLIGPQSRENDMRLDVRADRTLPAFSRSSLDDNPGNGDPADGDPQGYSNAYLYWDTADDAVVDEAERWSLVLRLTKDPPRQCTVDVTPRRCQKFRLRPGTRVAWRVLALDGAEIHAGEAAADEWGLVTAPRVRVRREGVKLEMRVKG